MLIGIAGGYTSAAYTIKGTIKNLTCFYPKVYLAVLNKIDGMYTASYQDVIASANMDSSGNFIITGNELPDEQRFYRLYVTPDARMTNAIFTGRKSNYILLALDNKTDVTINCENFCTPFFTYAVSNSPGNEAMRAMQTILNTYNAINYDSLGATKKEFIKNKKYTELKQFADTTRNLLAGLWAVIEMDINTNYNKDATFFNSFISRFKKEAHAPLYATLLDEQLLLLQYKKGERQYHPPLSLFIIISVLLICSVLLNIYFGSKRSRTQVVALQPSQNEPPALGVNKEDGIRALIESLTIKEREILSMIHEGLSNKEIADRLNVEVSTVKTHVSRIYQKTDIKNRKEVAGIARYL